MTKKDAYRCQMVELVRSGRTPGELYTTLLGPKELPMPAIGFAFISSRENRFGLER